MRIIFILNLLTTKPNAMQAKRNKKKYIQYEKSASSISITKPGLSAHRNTDVEILALNCPKNGMSAAQIKNAMENNNTIRMLDTRKTKAGIVLKKLAIDKIIKGKESK